MMLNERQKQIFLCLDENKNSFIKGIELANKVNCSLKTLQNTVKEMKIILEKYQLEIISMTSKGYNLIIHDQQEYNDFKQLLLESDDKKDFNNQGYRITYILSTLLSDNHFVKADDLASQMYVSRSSVSSDLKIVKRVLEKYQLKIEHKPNYGMIVVGLEKDKRDCIIKEQLELQLGHSTIKKEWLATISDIVVDSLMKAKYRISDVVLQNLVLHICVSIQRMQHGIYIDNPQMARQYGHEHVIAKKILDELASIYHFIVTENEISFLAIHLLGKRSYEENDLISKEIDYFVNGMLEEIKIKTDIDFYGDVELKISLALHLVPLLVRLESQMQLQNTMIQDIQANYPLAYDVAVIAASYISEQKHYQLSSDEVGYLAVHFSLSLSKKENKINPKKVLIICNARRGDYLMIQHTFLKEFNEMISDLEIINALEIPQYNLDDYDCIFATFLNHPLIPKRALRINFFIDQKDIQRIKNSLQGQSEAGELLKYFKEEYFMGMIDAKNQKEVIQLMCEVANKYNEFEEDLFQSCIRREELGSTAYGQLIALPHPDYLISQKTIVITAILDKPIVWSKQKAQLIFLICVEKGNQKDLRVLFECISHFMMDQQSVQDVICRGDYQTFTKNLGKLIG